MKPQGVLWAVLIFEMSAAIIFAVAGLVDAVAVLTTALFLTGCTIALIWAVARVGPYTHVSEEER